MSITLTALQKQRRDTAANWTTANPTLLAGEIGLESDTGYWKVGDGSTAWNSLAYVTGLGGEIPVSRLADGSARQLLQTAANGTDVEWTSNVDVPGTLDVTGAATFDGNVTVQGDLTVNGTTTTIDTTNLAIEDKNIEIGKVATPTDVTADGGGITLKGTTDKTINWVDATDAWTFSEHVNIASGKEYRINGTKVLDATSLGSGVLITSSNITDGTIVDGDINASAAIAGTKISPDFGSQTVTTTGVISAALGAAATPSLTFTGDLNTGIYSPGADQVAISTNGSGRLFVDASGNVGVGVSSPQHPVHIDGPSGSVQFRVGVTYVGTGLDIKATENSDVTIDVNDSTKTAARALVFSQAGNERLRITSAGNVGIGTASPGYTLDVAGTIRSTGTLLTDLTNGDLVARELGNNSANNTIEFHIRPNSGKSGYLTFTEDSVDDRWSIGIQNGNGGLRFISGGPTSGTERARLTSSGQWLVGTSTSPSAGSGQYAPLVVQGYIGSPTGDGGIALQRGEGAATITSGEEIGGIYFNDNAGNTFANIKAIADANAGTNDYPGRLTFSTTADGASSPTRRMTIKQDGSFVFGDFDAVGSTATGGKAYIESNSTLYVAVSGGTVAYFNRNTDDGEIVALRQANVTEGSISVSGTTVTYGGGHLARWSQLPNNEDPSSILKGTVMSNLDEMCEWGDENNEQLNKTKISEVEGDPNVAGVFVATSFDEDGPLDFFVGMTGDMVIRIASGVSVQRGDLLMSAGDGTAKPQDDDIIRSKTIAKVTSTNVSCTYDDGSYCVPCVLMAC